MATGHVGHNCVVGNDVKIVNSGLLAGHVEVGDGAFISGNAGVHQFVRIGELAMIAGGLRVILDVPPFMLLAATGVAAPNVVGLRRAGFTEEQCRELRACHRVLYRSKLGFRAAIEQVAEMVRTDPGRRLVAFLRGPTKRGFSGLRRRRAAASRPETESP
jgi:UDP-N-acetylglucosamine acyltransferase